MPLFSNPVDSDGPLSRAELAAVGELSDAERNPNKARKLDINEESVLMIYASQDSSLRAGKVHDTFR